MNGVQRGSSGGREEMRADWQGITRWIEVRFTREREGIEPGGVGEERCDR